MDVGDLLLIAVRWAHALAAAAWVGGGTYYLLVLRPALEVVADESSGKALRHEVAAQFKEVVDLCVITLLATGAVITFERLSRQGVDNTYLAVLGLKLAASAGMIWLSRSMARTVPTTLPGDGAPRRLFTPARLALALGATIFLLASTLALVYEKGLSAF